MTTPSAKINQTQKVIDEILEVYPEKARKDRAKLRGIARRVPHTRLLELPDCGHSPHRDQPAAVLGALDALPVALLVLGIGLSLGGPTGYAINPARDLGPRIAHFILPIKGKGSSDWGYAWVPVIGPILGALLAALLYTQF